MTQIQVTEVIKMRADEYDFNDVDKFLITLVSGTTEQKILIPYQLCETVSDFVTLLSGQLAGARMIDRDIEKVTNLTTTYSGIFDL